MSLISEIQMPMLFFFDGEQELDASLTFVTPNQRWKLSKPKNLVFVTNTFHLVLWQNFCRSVELRTLSTWKFQETRSEHSLSMDLAKTDDTLKFPWLK